MSELSLTWTAGSRAQDEVVPSVASRLREGDPELFAEIVAEHQGALLGYLQKMTHCPDRAQELAQEAFVRLFTGRAHYREQGLLSAYLFRIATNLLRTQERRKTRWRRIEPLVRAGFGGSVPSPQRDLESRETSDLVAEAIASLPLKFRAPLVLREIEGWSYAEVAAALECQEGTVKSRVSRAKVRLKRQLSAVWNNEVSHAH
jgi:RNA polymerase sigma-70 factor (ECF subfamily)